MCTARTAHGWSTSFRDVFKAKTNDTMKNQDQKGEWIKIFLDARKRYVNIRKGKRYGREKERIDQKIAGVS
nr:MAG TPA: hypothetical protein [Caudoviricetes sp.]